MAWIMPRHARRALLLASCVLLALAVYAPGAFASTDWSPEPGTSWQWQLSGRLDAGVKTEVYDVDGVDTSASAVSGLHAKGRHVVCYLSAGSWENWRPDAADFPSAVRGRALDGWQGERWLDVRRLDVLGPIMEARIEACRTKGFDAVELDNVDGYANDTGFSLSSEDQLTYNRALAGLAHDRGLSVALKNDLGQVDELEPDFDFAINEECFRYHECDRLEPFVDAGKAVLHVEYDLAPKRFCPKVTELGFSSMRKRLKLNAWRRPCPKG